MKVLWACLEMKIGCIRSFEAMLVWWCNTCTWPIRKTLWAVDIKNSEDHKRIKVSHWSLVRKPPAQVCFVCVLFGVQNLGSYSLPWHHHLEVMRNGLPYRSENLQTTSRNWPYPCFWTWAVVGDSLPYDYLYAWVTINWKGLMIKFESENWRLATE